MRHGAFKKVETDRDGIPTIRNMVTNQVDTYLARSQISKRQHAAAEIFAQHFDAAGLGAAYASVDVDAVRGGEMGTEAALALQINRQAVRRALDHVGQPLADVLEHCVGRGESVADWSGVKSSKRASQEGMTALRLALDGLVRLYNV